MAASIGPDAGAKFRTHDEGGHKKSVQTNEARLNDLHPADAEHTAKVRQNPETGNSGPRFSVVGGSLEQTITDGAIDMYNRHQNDLQMRNAAFRAIGGNLTHLRRAMAVQRKFDMQTVKDVSALAQSMMRSGLLDGSIFWQSSLELLLDICNFAVKSSILTSSVTQM